MLVVCIGDSITAGQYLGVGERSWPRLLTGYEVHDAGVSDDTTRLGLERFPRDVQDRKPAAVVIQFGHNDCNRWLTDHGLPRVSELAYRANLIEMVARCRTFGAVPFLCTLIPSLKSEQHADDLDRYDQALREVAHDLEVSLIDVRDVWDRGDFLMPDGVHPTASGHRRYATMVQAELDEWEPSMMQPVYLHNRIHSTAIVHPNTKLDLSVVIEPYCIVGSDHGYLELGPGTIIRSHSIIEGGSAYGPRLETGHHVLLRSGNEVGTNLRIGTGSSLEGGGQIGDYVRIHGRCEMTEGSLRHFARIYANCYITDVKLPPPPNRATTPATIDEGAVLTIGCVVVAGVRVGIGAFVGANTTVTKDVPDGMALVAGKLKSVIELHGPDYSYPWTGYLREGYPPEAWPRIEELHQRIMLALA